MLFTESGRGRLFTAFLSFVDCSFTELKKLPTAARAGLFACASAITSFVISAVSTLPSSFVGTFTPKADRKFNAPELRSAFVPITAPIRPTKPSDTAPRIRPREELSAAAATTIGIVAFKDGEALIFEKKLGPGVPERLIALKEDGEKLPDTEIDIESVGEIDREFDILLVSDKDGLAVLPGEGEIVVLVV